MMKTEADSNDITVYTHDDKPTTGMFRFYLCNILHLTVTAALSVSEYVSKQVFRHVLSVACTVVLAVALLL